MPRVAAGLVLAGALFLSNGARAQDASALNPAESACVGQSVGSACDSSTSTAGGTCGAGCCCHFVTDPEGASVCAPCLACSDTSYLDPAFKSGPCSDGGSLVSQDSGAVVPIYDAGGPTVGAPNPSPTSSNNGCSIIAVTADGASPSAVLLALGLISLTSVRRRTR
jgi:MYXO-CTERM domain-containing protein